MLGRLFRRTPKNQPGPTPSLPPLLIGNTAPPVVPTSASYPSVYSTDHSRAKYAFWACFRRGQLEKTSLSAALAMPIVNLITSFAMGRLPTLHTDQGRDYEAAIQDWLGLQHQQLLDFARDSFSLGDSYLLVNPDGTLVPLPPDIVTIETSPENRGLVTATSFAVRLTPQRTLTERYTPEERTITIREGRLESVQVFRNMFAPHIPIVHLAHQRDPNDLYGHSIFAPLLGHFERMNEIITRTVAGINLMGRPPGVFRLKSPASMRDEMSRVLGDTTATMPSNIPGLASQQFEQAQKYALTLERDPLFYLNVDEDFKFAHPGPLADDATKVMYEIRSEINRHVGLPEWVWGGPIPSSRASVDAQAPAFSHMVNSWRRPIGEALRQIVLLYSMVATGGPPSGGESRIILEWPAVLIIDEAQQLSRIKQAADYGLITRRAHLAALGLVHDPAEEVVAAEEEVKARNDAEDAAMESIRVDLVEPTQEQEEVDDG